MPKIYLSPSTQEKNIYYDGSESEEYYMNLIADALEPYLQASGIEYTRNSRDMTVSDAIAASNSDNYDLHLALHSNASAPEYSGQAQGTIVFYFPESKDGKEFADIAADNLKVIYPNPNMVKTAPTTALGEVANTRAPSVLIEFAFHDNPQDAEWIKNNINTIAKNVALSLTEYFRIPFAEPMTPETGVVNIRSGQLNIRSNASVLAPVVGGINDGEPLKILGIIPGWYVINYNGITGYVKQGYIDIIK